MMPTWNVMNQVLRISDVTVSVGTLVRNAEVEVERAPHVLQVLLPDRLVQAVLAQDVRLGRIGEALLALIEWAAGHRVHQGERDDRDREEHEEQRDDSAEKVARHVVPSKLRHARHFERLQVASAWHVQAQLLVPIRLDVRHILRDVDVAPAPVIAPVPGRAHRWSRACGSSRPVTYGWNRSPCQRW